MSPRTLLPLVIVAALMSACATHRPEATEPSETSDRAPASGPATPDATRPGPGDPNQVVRSDLGRLVADSRFFEGTNGLRFVAPDGTVEQLTGSGRCASGAGTASPDGARLAWVTFACPESLSRVPTVLHVQDAGGTHDVTLPQVRDVPVLSTAERFRGRDVVVLRARDEQAVLVDPTGERPPREIAAPST